MSQGYEFNLKDNGCSFYLNGMFHDYAPIVDGLFILNLETEPVYNMNVKRHKPNEINLTYFRHCRLGHISLKRMKKLHVVRPARLGPSRGSWVCVGEDGPCWAPL